MRVRSFVCVLTLILGAVAPAAQSPASQAGEQFLGLWTGTWDGGGGTGGFDLTLEKDKDGAVIGKVSVTGEPTYKATFKSMAFEGRKMTAAYDFPPDERAEIKVAATFEDNKATGTWALIEKGTNTEFISGGWTVTKK